MNYLLLLLPLCSCVSPEQARAVGDVMPEVIDKGLDVAVDVATGNWLGAAAKIVGIFTIVGGALWGGAKTVSTVKTKIGLRKESKVPAAP